MTLFLSIEVSKATKARAEAEVAQNSELGRPLKPLEHLCGARRYYGSMVEAFTSQLEESNPVLTAISDAMTAEGEALELGDQAAAARWAKEKGQGQEKLQEISGASQVA